MTACSTRGAAELRVTLPLPPSFNSAWRAFAFMAGRRPAARTILSEEARRWKYLAKTLLNRVPIVPALRSPTAVLELHLVVYVPTVASDCTNRVKLVEDALVETGHVHDDRAHVAVHVLKRLDGENPRVEVLLHEAPREEHAEVAARLEKSAREAEKRERRAAPRSNPLADLATPNTHPRRKP